MLCYIRAGTQAPPTNFVRSIAKVSAVYTTCWSLGVVRECASIFLHVNVISATEYIGSSNTYLLLLIDDKFSLIYERTN